MPSQPCRSCQAPVWWASHHAGEVNEGTGLVKTMPVNYLPDTNGNIELWRDDSGILRYRVLRKGEQPAPGHKLGTSHFETCEHADQHRRPRRPAKARTS